jgi:RNA polymerase sigma factor (sigma-70 family)
MSITMIGLDTAKSVFQVHGANETGKVEIRRKLRRSELIPFEKLETCTVIMEACGAAHHWARVLRGLLESIGSQTLGRLMEQLPAEYREVLLLREVEGLSYKEIAEVTGVPIGTVVSRLSRARLSMRKRWLGQAEMEDAHGL